MTQIKRKKNWVCKRYFNRNDVFADVMNLILYGGEPRILPAELQEMDGSLIRERDLVKKWGNANGREMILGIENQCTVDPIMPLRVVEYDTIMYRKEVEEKKQGQKRNELRGGEFLSGISKQDRICPVVTGVINLSTEKWDGARSIKEMTKENAEEFEEYRMKLLDPIEIEDKQIEKCRSDFKIVLKCLKRAESGGDLEELIKENEEWEVEEITMELMNQILGMKMTKYIKGKEGKISMCKSMEKTRDRWLETGRLKGKSEGKIEGKMEGKIEEKITIAQNMLLKGLSENIILECCKITRKQLLKIQLEMKMIAA